MQSCKGRWRRYQHGEQLEEVGVEPTQEEMTEVNLSEEEAEQQLSGETAELESATEWPASATGDEDNMKVQIDQIGRKEKEHTFQCAQEMEKEEHLVELLKNFSQGDEHEATVELGSTTGGEEHSEEWLKFFSQEAEKEMTVECEPTTEERETDSMDFVDLCEELEALERRVKMQSQLIQQVKLEIDGKEMQQNEMKEKSQPVDQLDKEIEDIKRLMLEAAQEAVNREGWNRRGPAGAAGQQRQQGRGASGQLQFQVWDPRGSQQHSRGSHEKELMIFPAVEYDAGASSASTRGETTQCPSVPLNHFGILTLVFPANLFFELIEN
jgi:hypothetical protein